VTDQSNPAILNSLDDVFLKEWIITNGIGGFASSSICGANTRRYHGLLVASFHPPTDRRVIFSKLEETVIVDAGEYSISTNQYPGTIHPQGYQFLKSFRRDPLPESHFESDGFSLIKSIFMIYGSNATVIEYHNRGNRSLDLQLMPLLVYRDYHSLFHENESFSFDIQRKEAGTFEVSLGNKGAPYYFKCTQGQFFPKEEWYRNFEYERERERGLDFKEDAFTPGHVRINLAAGEKVFFIISTENQLPEGDPSLWKSHELLRLESLAAGMSNAFLRDLIISGDQFIVWRISSKSFTVIAGYPWFTDWGRDTMIAMRGLIIATGKKQLAESILRTFLQYLDRGMIPNRFPDVGEHPEYNTIDATLWLFIVVYEYDQQFNDRSFLESIFPSLTEILEAHISGTRYHIHETSEGLLYGGEEGTQLTWMDAKVDNHVVTPRIGCAVEVNALWYNALKIYVETGKKLGSETKLYEEKILKTSSSFRKYFISARGHLHDVIIPGFTIDDSIRPNQVYAISLPFSPLEHDEGLKVLDILEDHLYTDLGLRSLSPKDKEFRAVFSGIPWERDHAYHQGTVWSYLWGEWALAYLNLNGHTSATKKHIRDRAKKLQHHFYHENGLYAISEVFDGLEPGVGKGCIQQAWSVGMLMKVLLSVEDL
jgi:predicted glycogen debranching enzyme